MSDSSTEVLMPTSAAQAIEAFGDGREVTVFAGGTILMPAISYGRSPLGHRTLMLERAGLDEISGESMVIVGAMTRLRRLAASGLEPLASALRENGSTRSVVPRMMPFDELNETLGKDDWDVNP